MIVEFAPEPGIVKDDTALRAKAYWSDAQWVRFDRGWPEDIGGWQSASLVPLVTGTDTYTVTTSGTIPGITRRLFSWYDTLGNQYLAAATHKKLAVQYGGGLYDITPFRGTSTYTSVFITSANSAVVRMALGTVAHGEADGDTMVVSGASAVGGITPAGPYVVGILNTATLTFTHSATATANGTGGGTTVVNYELAIGNQNGLGGPGYGVGGYGSGYFGVSSGSNWFPRTWALANFGQYLLANVRSGTIYEWQLSTTTRAQPLTNAPSQVTWMFVTPEGFAVAAGAHDGSNFDPMLVRWTDQRVNTTWTAAITNQAGDYRLSEGSMIVSGFPAARENLIWTDRGLYAMRYLADPTLVFGFFLLGTGCGLIGPNAGCVVGGRAFWMSTAGQFFIYDGGEPRPIPCSMRRYIFDLLSAAAGQQEKVYAFYNDMFNEVWWLIPTAATNECAVYVALDLDAMVFTTGSIARTAMVSAGVNQYPVMASTDQTLYIHEIGRSANGQNLNAYVRSGLQDVAEGGALVEIAGFQPDFHDQANNILVKVGTQEYPQTTTNTATYTSPVSSGRVDIRESGRQFYYQFERNDTDGFLRPGRIRFDIQPLGERQ